MGNKCITTNCAKRSEGLMCIRLFCMCKRAFSVVYCTHTGFLKTQGLYTIHNLSFSLQNAWWEIIPIGICRLPCYFSWQHSIPSYSCGVAASKTPLSHLEEGWRRGLSEFVTASFQTEQLGFDVHPQPWLHIVTWWLFKTWNHDL